MADRDRGAVFMRWKERFLVPDHRVQDINGASFAGQNFVSTPLLTAIPHQTPQLQHSLLTSFHLRCRFLLRMRGLQPSYAICCSLDNTTDASHTRE